MQNTLQLPVSHQRVNWQERAPRARHPVPLLRYPVRVVRAATQEPVTSYPEGGGPLDSCRLTIVPWAAHLSYLALFTCHLTPQKHNRLHHILIQLYDYITLLAHVTMFRTPWFTFDFIAWHPRVYVLFAHVSWYRTADFT